MKNLVLWNFHPRCPPQPPHEAICHAYPTLQHPYHHIPNYTHVCGGWVELISSSWGESGGERGERGMGWAITWKPSVVGGGDG